jgi:sulfur-oxidizing protein SoxA
MDRSGWNRHHRVGNARGRLTAMRRRWLLCCIGVLAWAHAPAGTEDPNPPARSGYSFLSAETRRMQDDDFANPGMLWVDEGRQLWHRPEPTTGKSCQSCHANPAQSMQQTAAHYPHYSTAVGRVINLEQQINRCRVEHMGSTAFAYESEPLLALTAFISHQAKGTRVAVSIDGPAATSFERGKQFFYRRRGQLNLSCANCHEQHVGGRLHGETISQGQINGFPIYRQLWQTSGSTHRMFAWCNEAVRSEPFTAGSQEYVDLELFERWRGRGLPIESPAVRR